MKRRQKILACGFGAVLVAGCSSSDSNPAGPTNTDGGEAGPSCGAPSVLGAAGRTSEGVLTNFPAFHFMKVGGVLDITTSYFDLVKLPDFNSLAVWGDVQNNTQSQQCYPYVDQFAVGSTGVLTAIDGPAYELEGSVVSTVCLEPGQKGAFRSIQNDVEPTLLDAPTTVSYSFTTLPGAPPNRRHPNDPQVVSAAAKAKSPGWTLSGQIRGAAKEIHTLEMRVYVRDPNGLLYNNLTAQPGELHTIPPSSVLDFETEPNRADFCSYEVFDVFIDGPEPPMPDGGDDGGQDGGAGD